MQATSFAAASLTVPRIANLHSRNHVNACSIGARRRCTQRIGRARMSAAHSGDDARPIALRIARAFVVACAPGDTPYAEAVRDFCRSALEAYRGGYSLSALRMELSTTAPERSLASDEAELRDVWLSLVYKTLRAVGLPGSANGDGLLPVPDKFDEFVRNVIAAVRAGYDLRHIQLEQALRTTEHERPRTTLESAILNQSTRLVIATLDVADSQLGGPDGSSLLRNGNN